jgi:hypothetical protein
MKIVGMVDLPEPWNIAIYEDDQGVQLVKDDDVPERHRSEYFELAILSGTSQHGYSYLTDYKVRASHLMRSRQFR